jgi:mRNA-degrading endonuclease toxin of MazEF toxin-antitoxin module
MPKQGHILLIPIPFTDLSSQKRRPVIVISNDQYNRKTGDVVVVAMTSNPQVTDYSFSISSSELVKGRLNRPGKVRVDKIYTLSQSIVAKTFGRVNAATLDRIRRTLEDLVGPESLPGIKDSE